MYAPDYSDFRDPIFEVLTPGETDAASVALRSNELGTDNALRALTYPRHHTDAPSPFVVHRVTPLDGETYCGRRLVEGAQALAETQFGPVPDHLFDTANLRSTLYVAVADSEVIGMMSVESVMRDDPFHHRDDALLNRAVPELAKFLGPMAFRDYFVVDTRFRGQGIGSKLSDASLDFIFGEGGFEVQMGATTLTNRCWGPAQQIVLDQGAVFVAAVEGLWRDDPAHDEELALCPACDGACACTALVYINIAPGSDYSVPARQEIPVIEFGGSASRQTRSVLVDAIMQGQVL